MSGGGGGGQIMGYWYALGYHMGLCRGPINSIVETRVGDKTLVSLELFDDIKFPVYKPELFGGEKAEGGVMGAYQVLMGKPDQVPPIELVLMAKYVQPGFRRMCTVFFDGFIGALNPYPKPWAFRVRRTDKGWDGATWYPEKIKIVLTRPMSLAELTSSPEIHAMNPAHIVYECLTNREWGRGLNRIMLSDTAFRAAADQLYAEGFGMCLRWTRTDSIESFVQSVIDHIGGVLRPNRVTGELELKLIRSDYVVSDLPVFDSESGLIEITEASVATLPSIINHVSVKYMDPITGKQASIAVHNLAGVQGASGEVNTMTKDYPGIPTPSLAARVAQRDLRASSSALRRFSFKLDRRGEKVRPGDAIRIRDIARNIPDMVVRVGRVESGTLLMGAISITAVQDVFGLPANSYIGGEPPRWEPPTTAPCIGYNRVEEMPYFLMARNLSAADLDYIKPEAGYIAQMVELGGRPMNAGYKLAVRESDITPDDAPDDSLNYCPTVPVGWNGGDCVKIVAGGLSWEVFPLRSEEGGVWAHVYQAPGAGPFSPVGSVVPDTFLAFVLMTPGSPGGSPTAPQTNLAFWGDGDEGYTSITFQKGDEEPITGTMSFQPQSSGPKAGVWVFQRLFPLFDCPAGESYSVSIAGGSAGGRVFEACCLCLEIRMTGTPTPNPGTLGAWVYVCNGIITTPSSLTNMNPGAPSWGSPNVDTFSDPDMGSDVSLGFSFGPENSPFLTSMMSCKVYDDSDGGALVYSTTLYKVSGMEGLGGFSYFERPAAYGHIEDAYPTIHSSPPLNPAAALNGHALRFVLGTANACCGGLPPSTGALRLTGVSIADILGPHKVGPTEHARPTGEGLQLWYNVPADADIKTTNPLDPYWTSNQSIYVLLEVEAASGGGYEPIEAQYPDYTVTVENVFGCVLSGISPTGGAMPQGPVAVIATGSSAGVGQAKVTIEDGHGETLRTFYVNSTDSSFTMPVLRSIPTGASFTNAFTPKYTASSVSGTGLRAINCDWQFDIGDTDAYYPGLPANTRLSGPTSGANEIVAPSGFKIIDLGVPYSSVPVADMSVQIACGVVTAAGTPNTIVNIGVSETEVFPADPANGVADKPLIANANSTDKFAPWGKTVGGTGTWAVTDLFTCSKGSVSPPGDIPG